MVEIVMKQHWIEIKWEKQPKARDSVQERSWHDQKVCISLVNCETVIVVATG